MASSRLNKEDPPGEGKPTTRETSSKGQRSLSAISLPHYLVLNPPDFHHEVPCKNMLLLSLLPVNRKKKGLNLNEQLK